MPRVTVLCCECGLPGGLPVSRHTVWGAQGAVALGQLSVGRGSLFWMLSQATLGRWDEPRGLGLASGGAHAPGRSCWGQMPTSSGPEGTGAGKGPQDPGPHTPWPSVSRSRCGWNSGRAPDAGAACSSLQSFYPVPSPPRQHVIEEQAALESLDMCYSLLKVPAAASRRPRGGAGRPHVVTPPVTGSAPGCKLAAPSAWPRRCSECPNKYVRVPTAPAVVCVRAAHCVSGGPEPGLGGQRSPPPHKGRGLAGL